MKQAAILQKAIKSAPEAGWRKLKSLIGQRTIVMGILNRTPDSFSDGGRWLDEEKAVAHCIKMAQEGADIIDIGGESTRPGAADVDVSEEIKRVVPIIKALRAKSDVTISIDTSKSQVAREAIEAGASLVNDVTALRRDRKMGEVVAKLNAGVVLMHMKGTPRSMQNNPQYKDLWSEIISYLRESIEIASEAGISKDKIIVDPGIGFGKTVKHNLEIIRNLSRLKLLGFPILIGTSRKSFIGLVLDIPVGERTFGTAATVALSIANGADIVRVHDVKTMAEVARMADTLVR